LVLYDVFMKSVVDINFRKTSYISVGPTLKYILLTWKDLWVPHFLRRCSLGTVAMHIRLEHIRLLGNRRMVLIYDGFIPSYKAFFVVVLGNIKDKNLLRNFTFHAQFTRSHVIVAVE